MSQPEESVAARARVPVRVLRRPTPLIDLSAIVAAALVLTAVERFGTGQFASPIGTTILAVGNRP